MICSTNCCLLFLKLAWHVPPDHSQVTSGWYPSPPHMGFNSWCVPPMPIFSYMVIGRLGLTWHRTHHSLPPLRSTLGGTTPLLSSLWIYIFHNHTRSNICYKCRWYVLEIKKGTTHAFPFLSFLSISYGCFLFPVYNSLSFFLFFIF